MSSSIEGSAIFVTDTPKMIRDKVHKYAFSGGRDTAEEHRKLGANLEVDVSYHYLRFLMEDEAKLEDIGARYKAGEIMSSTVKDMLVDVVCGIINDYKTRREKVTDDVLDTFMDPNRECFKRFRKN